MIKLALFASAIGTFLAVGLIAGCQNNQAPTQVSNKSGTADEGASTDKPDSSNQATNQKGSFMIDAKSWGKWSDGQEVQLYTLSNPNGMVVKLTNYGGHIVSVEVPDKEGRSKNITLGFDNLDSYVKHTAHFGATIGRYGNRIAKGKFTLDGKEYTLPINNGPNHLHGGPHGFDHQLWQAKEVKSPEAVGVEFKYVSKDGEEGYPGTLTATATYWLTKANELKIDYTATTDKDTVVNLTNHAYWNLAGAGSGDILGQKMMIAADKYLVVDDTLIPTGKMEDVKGTMMDFTSSKPIGPGVAEIKKQGGRGYDHCYVLRSQNGSLAQAAVAKDPASGRTMEVWTDQPGIQFYTGNFLDGDPINGGFPQHAAFCLETQHYPDAPNHPEFPSTELKPGETFKSTTIYKFSTE
ncbi:MAG TPA: aldose epimerase family protein [Pirellulales bacterium]|nr:aldose epimerase family protein [Pirellulales bacterium]